MISGSIALGPVRRQNIKAGSHDGEKHSHPVSQEAEREEGAGVPISFFMGFLPVFYLPPTRPHIIMTPSLSNTIVDGDQAFGMEPFRVHSQTITPADLGWVPAV